MAIPRVFISYKRNHKISEDCIDSLKDTLSSDYEFLHDVDIEASKRWTSELYDWLLGCDAAIVLISEEANKSVWCRREWEVLNARWSSRGLPVIPVFVEQKVFETGILDDIQSKIADLTDFVGQIASLLENVVSSDEMTPEDYLAAHHAWLKWQFNDAPVFSREPYSLKDVYIEPECGVLTWKRIKNDRLDAFQEDEDCGGRVNLLNSIMGYIGDKDFKELITLQAGPGAGKSAFTLRMANQLLDDGFLPILVRFRDLRISLYSNVAELLDDAIRFGPSDEDDQVPNPEESLIEHFLDATTEYQGNKVSRMVVIMDGWDEVSLTGNESFKDQLSNRLSEIREYFLRKTGKKIRVILTGRPSAEVSQSGVLKDITPVCTIRHIQPEQLRFYATTISEKLDATSDWQLDINELTPAFKHYDKWFENKQESEDSTGDILGNPLLAYLSFRVIHESELPVTELMSKPTVLYHELINITVENAGKGLDEELDNAIHRGGEKLRRLLQEVAATISIFRAESVSFKELEMRFESDDLPIPRELLEDWSEHTNTSSAIQEMLINFYFKGGNKDLGCEFLHKSFREYLFAECIYYSLLDSAENRPEFFRPTRQYEYWQEMASDSPEHTLSRRFAYLLAPQWLTNEVRDHLFWLIERDINNPNSGTNWLWLRDAVLSVYAWWAEGALNRHQPKKKAGIRTWKAPFIDELFEQIVAFDENNQPPIRTVVLDSHLGHALMQITAFVFHNTFLKENPLLQGSREATFTQFEKNNVYFKPGGTGFFASLVAKFDVEGWKKEPGMSGMLLRGILIDSEKCNFINASKCDLSYSVMLNNASFSESNFDYSNLSYSHLTSCSLSYCSMHSVGLIDADLTGAVLTNAALTNAVLTNADLTCAHLNYADLTQAVLTNADLTRAHLNYAVLTNADLTRAHLNYADLTQADLTQADLTRAHLNYADLTHADLTRAHLNYADLTHADLIGANLIGADLTGADLTNAKITNTTKLPEDF